MSFAPVHAPGGGGRTLCGLRVTEKMLVLPPRSAQHLTCKRCAAHVERVRRGLS